MNTAPGLSADPALEQLLFVLALFKGASTIGVLLMLRWRVRHPISGRHRLGYVVSAAAMCVATGLLVAQTALPLVPFFFDGGVIALVLLALRDAPMLRALALRFPNRDAVRVRQLSTNRRASVEAAMLRLSSATLRRLRR